MTWEKMADKLGLSRWPARTPYYTDTISALIDSGLIRIHPNGRQYAQHPVTRVPGQTWRGLRQAARAHEVALALAAQG